MLVKYSNSLSLNIKLDIDFMKHTDLDLRVCFWETMAVAVVVGWNLNPARSNSGGKGDGAMEK